MILVDANLLLYAKFSHFTQHRSARAWLAREFETGTRIGLPWPCLLAFQRIATNPRVFDPPLEPAAAWRQIENWLSAPNSWIPGPTPEHPIILGDLIDATQASGNLVADAHLAALALEHGLTLYSSDSDFARFPALEWRNPLAG